jgi:methyl-accepting chemotaxis protein
MASGRILTRELDTRIKMVEDKLGELVETLARLDEHIRHTARKAEEAAEHVRYAQSSNGGGDSVSEPSGKLADLEAVVAGLNERVEKITQTLIMQASRLT